MDIFSQIESNVRSYSRVFPALFTTARGATLSARDGATYIDFLSGAGALNYGHNNPILKAALTDYLAGDGITHSLDLATAAKQRFLESLRDHVLRPRGLRYKVQFTGPTGTNAVEAALKIARNATGRRTIVSFTNGFHGVTLGSLAVTASPHHRQAAGVPLTGATVVPYDGDLGPEVDTIADLEALLSAGHNADRPAGVIVETVQGEGGVRVARVEWLRRLESVCRAAGIPLIVDDIQAGCGRTGRFFSFEEAGLTPDIVVLSKSLSGFGLPMAVLLLTPELDTWAPGAHNGTFRGHNLAFVTAASALETYWRDETLMVEVARKAAMVRSSLNAIAGTEPDAHLSVRGRGLIQGLDCRTGELAGRISRLCFEHGLVVETAGLDGQVVKCLCPLTISDTELDRGLDILTASAAAALDRVVVG
jgi:diaminobutyrate-2-oxoglutarate transaminase